jgi:hypothetical protein
VEQCLQTHLLKTAPAFRVAMYLGAIAAGKFEQYREIFHAFSNALGVAYQLFDDLEDTHTNPASAIDTLMRTQQTDRLAARARISDLYATYKHNTYAALDDLNDPVLKTFLYRLCGRILQDA